MLILSHSDRADIYLANSHKINREVRRPVGAPKTMGGILTQGGKRMIRFFRGCRVLGLGGGLLALAYTSALGAASPPTTSARSIARVDRVLGEARVERGGASSLLKAGKWLRRSDAIKTGAGARLSLTFRDGSRLAMGENALLLIGDYQPEQGRKSGTLIVDLRQGALRLTAAEPAKAPVKRVEIRTRAGRITARSMDVWSGPVEGKVGVLLIGGRADVRNDAGSVVLHRKRLATLVSNQASVPEKAVSWPKEKVKQALLTVAFK
jgi:hypothetical protein